MRGQRVLTPKHPKKGSIPVFCRKTRRKCISFLGTLFIFAKYETMQIVKFSALRAEGAPRSDGNNSRCVFAALLPEGDKCQISNLQWSHPPRIFDDFLLWSHPPGILSRQTRDKLATNSRQNRDNRYLKKKTDLNLDFSRKSHASNHFSTRCVMDYHGLKSLNNFQHLIFTVSEALKSTANNGRPPVQNSPKVVVLNLDFSIKNSIKKTN